MSLTLVCTTAATEEDNVCVITCTLALVARWMSAPAWTSRSTTSVWPFLLAAYTGPIPSYMEMKYDMEGKDISVLQLPAITHTLTEQFFQLPVAT